MPRACQLADVKKQPPGFWQIALDLIIRNKVTRQWNQVRLKLYTLLNRTLLQIQNIDPYSLNLIKLYFQYRIVTEWIQTHSFFRKKNNLKSCHNALVINLIRAFHPIFTFSKQGAGSMSTLWQPARGSHGNNFNEYHKKSGALHVFLRRIYRRKCARSTRSWKILANSKSVMLVIQSSPSWYRHRE